MPAVTVSSEPISVDLYDLATGPVATVLANVYRSDLYSEGYGNGYHGFVFTVPPYLKDGKLHQITGYFAGTHATLYYGLSLQCPAGTTGYVYYYTDPLTSINSSNWSQNGSVSATSSGLTATSTDGGALLSSVAVPDGTSDYEVKTTLALAGSGGTFAPLDSKFQLEIAASGDPQIQLFRPTCQYCALAVYCKAESANL